MKHEHKDKEYWFLETNKIDMEFGLWVKWSSNSIDPSWQRTPCVTAVSHVSLWVSLWVWVMCHCESCVTVSVTVSHVSLWVWVWVWVMCHCESCVTVSVIQCRRLTYCPVMPLRADWEDNFLAFRSASCSCSWSKCSQLLYTSIIQSASRFI